ncbi:MAG: hypothetical protein JXA69_13875 [Phycisphaerae bacterium]|nr:hypothetical protein [Phycisphaerae bacterium]
MRERSSLHSRDAAAHGPRRERPHHRPEFTPAETRHIFKQMVIAEMEGGLLRYSRRRELERYAESIGIPAFDANLLIAETQHRLRQAEPIEIDPAVEFPETQSDPWPSRHQLAFALVTAAILNLILIAWMIG